MASTNSTIDGMGFNATTINGTVGSFTNINVADSMSVAEGIMANEYYGKVNDSDNFPINSLTYGSGTDFTGGASMLAGVGTLGAGSEDWIVFEDEPFDDAPSVLLTNSKSSALLWTGSISKGSGLVFGATASDTYSWLAIGL